jgi:putative ABC transport system permease protein
MIVLIGVAFMMGLLSTRPIMEKSVDQYGDENDLQDIQIFSSYGFDENDIRAIRNQEFADKVFASRMMDVYADPGNGRASVTRLEEVERTVNRFVLTRGRMPQKDNERLVINNGAMSSRYDIGSTITVFLEDKDITESLRNTQFTIVGVVKSPSYMAKTLGTGTMKNLDLDTIIYIPASNFLSEYYTTVYVTVNGAKEFNSFSKDYDEFISESKGDIDVFAKSQQDELKEKLLDEYREKIADGEKELEEKKREAQEKLDDAKKKLDDANIQIIAGETQLSSLRSMLTQAEREQQRLQDRFSRDSQATYDRIRQIESGDPSHRSFTAITAALLLDWNEYNSLKQVRNGTASSAIQEQIEAARRENADLSSQIERLNTEKAEQQAIIAGEEYSEEEKRRAQARIQEIDSEIASLSRQIDINNGMIQGLENANNISAADAQARMREIDAAWGGSVENTYSEYTRLARDKAVYDALKEEKVIRDDAVQRIRQELASSEATLAAAKKQYQQGLREYERGVAEYNREIEKAEAEIRKAYQDLEELPDARWMILDRDSHYSSYMYRSNAKQMGAIGVAMPVLFFLVAALVCMTTMTRLVDEQRGQIGIFRALGFSKGQIISKYVMYALMATLIGSVLGIVIGMLIFPTVIYETWRLMYMLPDRLKLFPVENIFICILSFSLLMSAVTAFVANRTLKEQPSRLMRPKAPRNSKKVFLEYIPFLWDRLSFTSKITARNLIRYKTRFIMTVIGVAGCTGLLVLGWGIKDSIADVVDIQFGQIFSHEYVVNIENDMNLREITGLLEKDLDNEYVVPYMTYSSKIYLDDGDDTANMIVVDARDAGDVYTLRDANDRQTPVKLKNGGVIVSEKFAKNNGIKAGDYITLESREGIKKQVKVKDICEMYFQHYVFISSEYYDAVFSEPVHPNKIAVKNPTSNNIASTLKGVEGYESVINYSGIVEQFTNMIKALDYIIIVIIITAGSLAFVVLINLTQVNISERIREIATLKVLGFRTGEVNAYIFKEIFLLTLIGRIVGLPLGVIEHRFIMGVIDMEMIKFGTTVKFMSFVYAFRVTIVFSLIVLFITRKSLREIEMIESLKSVE